MLIDVAGIQAAQRVLVLGGFGGVGSSAVQIAHNLGAYVAATASAEHLHYLRGRWPACDAAQAWAYSQGGHTLGKTVIVLQPIGGH